MAAADDDRREARVLQSGDHIDIWVVDRALGHGGMGSVYRCHNRDATRILAAVKVLEGTLARFPEMQARFVREAEILFALDHPNIVRVRNARVDHHPPYLEMEFIEGESLDDVLEPGALLPERALDLMRQSAAAVQHLHANGVFHRDIKPANFLLRHDGVLKLVDFGLALEAEVSRITQHNTTFGTAAYAPPEWAQPETLDPKLWDIYALGVVWWEMLTGNVAFPTSGQGSARQQAMQVMIAKQNHPALDPGPRFDAGLRALIRGMTHPDPRRRLSSLDEVERALSGVQVAAVGLVEEPPAPRRWLWWGGAGLATVSVVGALAIAALGVAGASWWASRERSWELTVDPTDAAVSLALDGAPLVAQSGSARASLRPGEHRLDWAAGDGCEATACARGACPDWCGFGHAMISVDRWSFEASTRWDAPEPPRHTLRWATPLAPDQPATASLGTVAGQRDGEAWRFDAVRPGRHALEITVGDCADRCESERHSVDIAWTDPEPAWPAWPVLAPPPPQPAPQPAPRTVAPKAPAIRADGYVTVAAFAAWLAEHPEYQPGGAFAAGDAHLEGWRGATPPGNLAPNAMMKNVNARAATEYCSGRGGLVTGTDVGDANATIAFEWRKVDGRTQSVDMATGHVIPNNGALAFIAFRCQR